MEAFKTRSEEDGGVDLKVLRLPSQTLSAGKAALAETRSNSMWSPWTRMTSTGASLKDFIRVRVQPGCLVLNMSSSPPLRRNCLLILLAVAIVGCQSVVDSGYGEKGSLVGRMSVPEIEDALQVCPEFVSLCIQSRALANVDFTTAMPPRTRPQSTQVDYKSTDLWPYFAYLCCAISR